MAKNVTPRTGIAAVRARYRNAIVHQAFGMYFVIKNSKNDDGIISIGKTEELAIMRAEMSINHNPKSYTRK